MLSIIDHCAIRLPSRLFSSLVTLVSGVMTKERSNESDTGEEGDGRRTEPIVTNTRDVFVTLLMPAEMTTLHADPVICLQRASFILRRHFYKTRSLMWNRVVEDLESICLVSLGHGEIKRQSEGGKRIE